MKKPKHKAPARKAAAKMPMLTPDKGMGRGPGPMAGPGPQGPAPRKPDVNFRADGKPRLSAQAGEGSMGQRR